MGALSPPPGSPLGPAAIGGRVVVRHRDADGRLSDVLGVLERWDVDGLAVRRRSGELVNVAAAAVRAARVVPPQRVTTRAVRALETVAAQGWPGLEQEHLRGWLLRAGGGFTGRANSVLPLGDPGLPLDAAVAVVERWYDARGLVPRAQLPDRLGAVLDDVLAAHGWPAGEPVLVLVRDLPLTAPAGRAQGLPPVQVHDEPDDAWLAAGSYQGTPWPPAAVEVLRAGSGLGFAALPGGSGGGPLAVARASVADAPDGSRWVGLTALGVMPGVRRSGLGAHLVQGVLRWAAQRGATRGYLQVRSSNDAARHFCDRLGFTEHHRYHYRQRPG